jgi:hypothetical protein
MFVAQISKQPTRSNFVAGLRRVFWRNVMGRHHAMVNTITLATALVLSTHVSSAQSFVSLNPSTLPRIAEVDEGFHIIQCRDA